MSAHADKILAAVAAEHDTSALVASWRRSIRVHKLHPDQVLTPERDTGGWHMAVEQNGRMLGIARRFINDLATLFADTLSGISVCDANCMLLDIQATWETDTWQRDRSAALGTVYSEAQFGTNACGTCIADERGQMLRGEDHFLTAYTRFKCVSAPIFGPEGEIAGCLVVARNLADCDSRLDPYLSMIVANYARRIEIETFADAFPRAQLMLLPAPNAHPGALLAVDADRCVIGATRLARKVLGAESMRIGAVALEDMIGIAADDESLRSSERRAIQRALARTNGNILAAAQLTGISRSTLYRKMAEYGLRRDS